MSFSSFFGIQPSDSTFTNSSKKKSSSSHFNKPSLRVNVPKTPSKYKNKIYLPPTDNCASPLGTFGSSFLLRTSDLYNFVNIIDGDDYNNNGASTHDKNSISRTTLKTRLTQNNNEEVFSPLSPIYSDMKTRRNPISDSLRFSPSYFTNDEEIYVPYVSSPKTEGRNSYDSGVGMTFDEKLDDNDDNDSKNGNIKNVTSREIDLNKSSKISDQISSRNVISSSVSPIIFNSSLHKSSLYGPSGIPPLFTSSVNDYIGDSAFSGNENWMEY
ncbi:14537_t:CDS:1 [Acaulospora colombiana]|uniref:14537_t:CDS:1 n=1 Tax=Acaulospora colombiana TaxID=27376 RepID=A0ACA9MHR1_9GLOM|nr:14537_t:CDS:1 [Acaulospora colombiana]